MSENYGLMRPLVFITLRLLEPVLRLVLIYAPFTAIALTMATDPLLEWSRPRYLPDLRTDLRVVYTTEGRG
jgi:hypothetical protein